MMTNFRGNSKTDTTIIVFEQQYICKYIVLSLYITLTTD